MFPSHDPEIEEIFSGHPIDQTMGVSFEDHDLLKDFTYNQLINAGMDPVAAHELELNPANIDDYDPFWSNQEGSWEYPVKEHHHVEYYSGVAIWVPDMWNIQQDRTQRAWKESPDTFRWRIVILMEVPSQREQQATSTPIVGYFGAFGVSTARRFKLVPICISKNIVFEKTRSNKIKSCNEEHLKKAKGYLQKYGVDKSGWDKWAQTWYPWNTGKEGNVWGVRDPGGIYNPDGSPADRDWETSGL